MLDFIGDLFEAGADLIGGLAKGAVDVAGGLFGGGSGGGGLFSSIFGGEGGRGILGLGMDIFGGSDGDASMGLFNSPVMGHVLGAVGTELMRGDPVKEHARMYAAQREAERKAIRANYGLDGHGAGGPIVYTPPYSTAGAM